MKYLIFSIVLNFFSNLLWANENYKFFCHGNRGKVNVLLEKIDSKVRFTYTNQSGKKEFPLYEGVVTLSTFPILNMAKFDLSLIDTKLILEWKIEQCQKNNSDPMIVECNGESDLIFPINAKIKSFDFYTSKTTEKTPHFTFEFFKIHLGLDSESMHYLIAMPFDPLNCTVYNPENFQSK